MRIIIKSQKKRETYLSILYVNKNDTILEVKQKYGRRNIQFKYNSKILEDDKIIGDYKIKDDDIIEADYRKMVKLIFQNMRGERTILEVDEEMTLGEIRKILIKKGGEEGINQWLYSAVIFTDKDDNKTIKELNELDGEEDEDEIVISVTPNTLPKYREQK